MTRRTQKTIACTCIALAALACTASGYAFREPLIDRAWIALLRHGGPPVRARAAGELGRRRALRAVPHLVHALRNDAEKPVRDAAAEALGAVGPAAGNEALWALVESVDTRNVPLGL